MSCLRRLPENVNSLRVWSRRQIKDENVHPRNRGLGPIQLKYAFNQKSGTVKTSHVLDLVHIQIFSAFHKVAKPGCANKQTHKQTNNEYYNID